MPNIKIDTKDKKILAQLDMDARLPFGRIAKKVGVSREVATYRIKRMERLGLVEGYYTVLDIAKLGFKYCRIFIKYSNMDPKTEEEIIQFCKSQPYVGWIAIGEGNYDLTIVYWVKKLGDIDSFLLSLNSKYGSYVRKRNISFAYLIHHFPHSYIHIKDHRRVETLGYEVPVEYGIKEEKILRLISKDALMKTSDLAKKANMNSHKAIEIIRRLESEKIILCYRAKINTSSLGYEHYKVFLFLKRPDDKCLKQLTEVLSKSPHVVYITRALGRADLEFEVFFKHRSEFHLFMKDLSVLLPDIIDYYESLLYFKEPYINYFPVDPRMTR